MIRTLVTSNVNKLAPLNSDDHSTPTSKIQRSPWDRHIRVLIQFNRSDIINGFLQKNDCHVVLKTGIIILQMIDSITMTWTPVIYLYEVDTSVVEKSVSLKLNICGRM